MEHPIWSIACALAAALLFAVAAVAQQRAAAAVPAGDSLVRTLLRSPRWWAGIVGDGGGYGLQVAALALGPVLLVQPLLVTSLVFALPIAARVDHRTVGRRTWAAALLLLAALGCFLVVGAPTSGNPTAPLRDWAAPSAVLLGAVILAVVAGSRSPTPEPTDPAHTPRRPPDQPTPRGTPPADPTTRSTGPPPEGSPAAESTPATVARSVQRPPPASPRSALRAPLLFGAAGGALFGLAAALTDFVAGRFTHGLGAVLTTWQTWALVAAGVVGVYVQQRAFQVGSIAAALPAATIAEPLAAAFLGLTVLDERLRTDGFGLVVVVASVAVLCVTTVRLAHAQAAE
ncbi:DMT family transporter [Nocardia farcinica]|uniref:DMT family transporter n=1 Tax=Nocardia farcinica TaxID=37329 RepID=UPI00311D74EC